MSSVRRNSQYSAPQTVRMEVLRCATDDSVVVVELDSAPSPEWIALVQKRLRATVALEDVEVKAEGMTLYFVGFGRSTVGAPMRVAKVLAEGDARLTTRHPSSRPVQSASVAETQWA